jgi:hypothetical protein
VKTKSIWQSKTIWGIAIMAASPLLQKLGLYIDEQTAGEIAAYIVDGVGAALAIYGRISACRPVGDHHA